MKTIVLLVLFVAVVIAVEDIVPVEEIVVVKSLEDSDNVEPVGEGGDGERSSFSREDGYLRDRERYEQGGDYDRHRDREWGHRFRGEHRFHRCMRGCLREEGIRRERRCQDVCSFYDEDSEDGDGYGGRK